MSIGCNILAYDVSYNRETTHDQASYFSSEQELYEKICYGLDIHNGRQMKNYAIKRYLWKQIAKQYEQLF
jgi:glycosyltransferase involved in cell wall biosynthesis